MIQRMASKSLSRSLTKTVSFYGDDLPGAKTLETFTTLKEINVSIRRGEFVTIIGDVASGKSSFLSTLIGDMLALDE